MGSLPVNGITHHVSAKGFSSMPSCVSPIVSRQRPNIRSPVESPPLTKKPLRFAETGRLVSKTLDNTLSCFIAPRSSERGDSGKENRSILKTNSHRRTGSKSGPGRKVNFQPKVLVFHFDRDEGSHVSSESKTLNSEPKGNNLVAQFLQSQSCPSCSSASINSSGNSVSSVGCMLGSSTSSANPATPHQNSSKGKIQSNDGSNPRQSPIGTQSFRRHQHLPQKILEERSLPVKGIDFHYAFDDSQTYILSFTIPLGPGISAGDVIVKANKTGNRVRVIGIGSNQRCRDINERFGLPVRVDSYRICARIDSNGVLFVEAPIVQGELKHGLHVARKST